MNCNNASSVLTVFDTLPVISFFEDTAAFYIVMRLLTAFFTLKCLVITGYSIYKMYFRKIFILHAEERER